MTEPLSFGGQVAVVTGGGRGLGRAYAVELASRGAAVLVNDVSGPHADEVVAEIAARGGTAAASQALGRDSRRRARQSSTPRSSAMARSML